MKNFFIAVTLLTSVMISANAQNFKNLNAKVNYLSIPEIIQKGDINTYNVQVNGYEDDLNNLGYSAGSIADKLNLRSFSRVEGEGENRIVFRFSGYGNLYGNLSTQVQQDGKSKYYYTYSYTLPMSYEIYALGKRISGREIKMKQGMNQVEQYSYSSKLFATSTEANQYWNGNGRIELINHIKSNFDAKFKVFVTAVRDEIDYQEINGFAGFGYFKSTKKVDFTDYERAAESAERALKPLVAGQPRTDLKIRLDSSLTFWKKKMTELDFSNKDEDKLFFACANNIALAYYWFDNIDSAQFFIAEAEKSDVRAGYLSMLKLSVETRKTQLILLKANNIDPYSGPEPATYEEIKKIAADAERERAERDAIFAAKIAAEEMKLAPVIETYTGFVIDREDKKINGSFKCYRANTGDRKGKNFFIQDGTDIENEVTASFVKSCEFGSYKYELVRYLSGNGMSKENNVLQLLFDSPKIKVFKEVYLSKDGKITFVNIYYKRPNEELATNTSSVTFTVALKKQLTKYFEDCSAVVTKIQAGEYPDSEEMRVAAAIDYNSCK